MSQIIPNKKKQQHLTILNIVIFRKVETEIEKQSEPKLTTFFELTNQF